MKKYSHFISPILCLAFVMATTNSAIAATANDCAWADAFVSRSGPLPYAGTLSQQLEGIMTNSVGRKMKTIKIKVKGEHAYRIRFLDDNEEIVENLIYNHQGKSFQITLVSSRQKYRSQLGYLRKILRHPFDKGAEMCDEPIDS
jgi:hypothetical protein